MFFTVVVLLLGFAGAAGAYPYEFNMGSNSWVDTSGTNDVLKMFAIVNPGLDDIIFKLEKGESYSFLYATFGTNESWVNNDDLNHGSLTAYVDFDNPYVIKGVNGKSGVFTGFFNFLQGWHITWDDPLVVDFGNGGQFEIELDEVCFSSWFWRGPKGTVNVDATITLNSAPDPVPVPGTMLLLLSGLIGLLGFGRKFKKL